MSIHTIERPQQRVPPIIKPEELEENEPYPYGWRYITKELPGGQTIVYQVALTEDDLLNPQEGDQVPQRTKHAQCSIDIFEMLKNHYRDNSTVGVFYDLIMKWGISDLAEPSPDVTVIPNVKDKEADLGHFEVKKEGTRPDLVIEIVSPSTASSDYHQKVDIYERAGVREYLLIDPHSKRVNPYFEIKGYRLDGQRYRLITPNKVGCFLSQTTQVWFCPVDKAQRLRLKDAKTGHWLLTASEEQQRRLESEAWAKQEVQTRKQAEAQAKQEIQAREQAEINAKQAEIKAEQEVQVRKQAEIRVKQEVQARKQVETEAKQIKQEKELAQQQVALLREKLRQLGVDPDIHA